MNLFDKVSRFFGYGYTPVYCQHCNKNITHQGGSISSTGKAYCQSKPGIPETCIQQALQDRKEKRPEYRFASTDDLQHAIEQHTLKYYGPLEKKTT